MVTFRNNNNVRRNNFRRNDRSFKSNIERPKYGSNFSKNENFQRKSPGRNNHNASKLIELNRLYAVKRNYCSTCDSEKVKYSAMDPLRN